MSFLYNKYKKMIIDEKANLFIKIVSSCSYILLRAIHRRVYVFLKKSEFLESINSLIAFLMSRVLPKVLMIRNDPNV